VEGESVEHIHVKRAIHGDWRKNSTLEQTMVIRK
jgi:hypothetical protein